MNEGLLSPKRDVVFQNLFGKIGNEEITEEFLSSILGRRIKGVSLDVTKQLGRQKMQSKLGLLDFRVTFADGTSCNIELQVIDYHNIIKRILYYWSRLYSMGLGKSQNYTTLKQTISILILDYSLEELTNIKKGHTVWNLREKDHLAKILSKDIELHILELPKFKDSEIKTKLDIWIEFIKNPESEVVKKEMEENEVLKRAMKELEYLSGDEDFQRLAEAREKSIRDEVSYRDEARKEGEEKGRLEGKAEGEKTSKLIIAKKMKEMKLNNNLIEKATGLTKGEIETL